MDRSRIGGAKLLSLGLLFTATAGSTEQPPFDLDRQCGTAACVNDLVQVYCDPGSSTEIDCRRFLAALERSSRRNTDDQLMTYAAALQGLASLLEYDAEEREELRRRQRDTYADLVRRDPHNAPALLQLALVTEARAERLAMLKRAVAAGASRTPHETLYLRMLAMELAADSEPAEMAQGVEHLLEAYRIAEVPHRWHLGQEVVEYMIRAGLHPEALEFQRRVLTDMGVPKAEQVVRNAASKTAKERDNLVAAVNLLCDRRTIRLGSTESCLAGIEALANGEQVTPGIVEAAAHGGLWLARNPGAEHQDPALWDRLHGALMRFSGSPFQGPLLEAALAQTEAIRRSDTSIEQARALLEIEVKAKPGDGIARTRLGELYLLEGRFSDAITQLEAALPLLPHDKVLLARTYLLRALRKDGQPARAEELEREMRH